MTLNKNFFEAHELKETNFLNYVQYKEKLEEETLHKREDCICYREN